MKRHVLAACAAMALGGAGISGAATPSDADKKAVLENYANIAEAGYADSLATARSLQKAIAALIEKPSEKTMQAAREAWLAARVPYQQTEAYRFGNKIVDEWEGKVNAWPLDEGLIDYVSQDYAGGASKNPLYSANVIANEKIVLGAKTVDASNITKEFLADTLHEFGQEEANVATGYHAIEFLLWGQDLNGTGPGAGERPWTDYVRSGCTHGNCARRAAYLSTAADLLIDDLGWIVAQWQDGGDARAALMKNPHAGLAAVLKGIGSLSYGELAGERMKLGLMLHDPEEEHDCFSDNTHNSHYYDAMGIRNVYTGRYVRVDGSVVEGKSVADIIAAVDPALNTAALARLEATEQAMAALKTRAETRERYDQMIGKDNPEGNAVVQKAIDALTAQTRVFERIVAKLNLKSVAFEGSDSLDDPAKVFQ